jgi:hypothetical protein
MEPVEPLYLHLEEELQGAVNVDKEPPDDTSQRIHMLSNQTVEQHFCLHMSKGTPALVLLVGLCCTTAPD